MIPRTLEPEVMDTAEEADSYDRMDHSAPHQAFVQRLIEIGARGRMIDIGTGPGQIPVLVAERVVDARVVGIDLSAHMLRHAERHKRASAHGDRVEFRQGNARQLDFPDQSFDAVFSNTILHHIHDPRPFLREAKRVLRPGGALLIRDLYRPWSLRRADELVALHACSSNRFQQDMFRASLCAALTPFELRRMADECGLAEAEITIDSDRHVSLQIAGRPW